MAIGICEQNVFYKVIFKLSNLPLMLLYRSIKKKRCSVLQTVCSSHTKCNDQSNMSGLLTLPTNCFPVTKTHQQTQTKSYTNIHKKHFHRPIRRIQRFHTKINKQTHTHTYIHKNKHTFPHTRTHSYKHKTHK